MNRLREIYTSLGADQMVGLWLAVWWVCNLLQASITGLAIDEAYYHLFAQDLAWGYYDHPPMTALLVWLGEQLFGGGLFGLRFFFVLLQPLYLWILWRLIRPADADRRDGMLFVVISAATLMLQLYGFIAVPDAPLMISTAVFLLCYKWFCEHRRASWLWMGAAMALMAYSKYHGALVVLFALAANPRLLLRWQLYLSGAVALCLFVPHLLWQYNHDWVSFNYHLVDRNSQFRFSDITEYLLNLLVVFNPFFVPIYWQAWRKTRAENPVHRVLKFLLPAFILFFGISAARGHVQPQWLIAATFGLIYLLFTYVRQHPRTRRYVMRAGAVTLILLVLVRIEMGSKMLGIPFGLFDDKAVYERIAQAAAGRPLIFNGGYAVAAKYNFYTGAPTYCESNVFFRTHQWQYRNDDRGFTGQSVLIEYAPSAADSVGRVKTISLPNGDAFSYVEESDFHPTREVTIAVEGLSEKLQAGDTLDLRLRIANPYPYEITINGGEMSLVILWRAFHQAQEYAFDKVFSLPAKGAAQIDVQFVVPNELAEKRYKVGFALRKRYHTYWFNGKSSKVEVLKR